MRAYIIRITNPISVCYAKIAADSCDAIGLQWEYVQGLEQMMSVDAWKATGLDIKTIKRIGNLHNKAACASASHALVWKKIAESNEPGIVLEHDSLMLHSFDSSLIRDGIIHVLGYKLSDPTKYDHVSAGAPVKSTPIRAHEGAHAYCITPETAKLLIKDLETIGAIAPVDNMFFLQTRKTKLPLEILDPTPAIGWIRESTIWKESASKNYPFIESFSRGCLSELK